MKKKKNIRNFLRNMYNTRHKYLLYILYLSKGKAEILFKKNWWWGREKKNEKKILIIYIWAHVTDGKFIYVRKI